MKSPNLGQRLKRLREMRRMTQDEAAARFGFTHRQTLAEIEAGRRALLADELLLAIKIFDVDFDTLTDPFSVAGEARFCLVVDEAVNIADGLVDRLGRMFGIYRAFAPRATENAPFVSLPRGISLHDVVQHGRWFAETLGLDVQTWSGLAASVERALGIPVVIVPQLPECVHGAVCRLDDVDGIAVSDTLNDADRMMTLARLLFHLHSWKQVPFPAVRMERVGTRMSTGRNHAEEFILGMGVTPQPATREGAPLLGPLFMKVIAQAIIQGEVSVRRVARELDIVIEELAELFEAHGVANGPSLVAL